MNIHFTFLKSMSIFYLSFFFLPFFNCSSDVDVEMAEIQEPLTDVLTLELSFGDEKTIDKDEFLLARPFGPFIGGNGDIIVSDESSLKVYDKDGNPKKIIGRPGQGPGEFRRIPFAHIMENGTMSVTDDGWLSLYNPDYSFIDTKDFNNDELYKNLAEEKGWGDIVFNGIYACSFDELIIFTQASGPGRGQERKYYNLILHQHEDKINTIIESFNEAKYNDGWQWHRIYEEGELVRTLLPERKLAYSEAHRDKVLENGTWYYFIYIYDLDTQEQTQIKKAYTPVAIPDSVIHPEMREGYDGDRIAAWRQNPDGTESVLLLKDRDKKRTEVLEELKYYPAIQRIKSDGNLLFAKTYQYNKGKGYVFEVFDIETGSYLRSVYFSFDPVIKNGYAYRIYTPKDGFSVIEKYRIDPAVYGK